jgi:glycosyltransferase involved in cell wall biosynthesis
VEVCFVLPTAVPLGAQAQAPIHVQLRTPANIPQSLPGVGQTRREGHGKVSAASEFDHLEVHKLPANMQAYASPAKYDRDLHAMLSQGLTDATGGTPEDIPGQVASDNPTPAETCDAGRTPNHAEPSVSFPQGSFVMGGAGVHYDGDLVGQIRRYAALAVDLARGENFDVIHAHDWMTFPAGQAVAKATGKPLVVQVHSTEFDRSGLHVNQQVYDIERAGMEAAQRVICVSHLTRNIVMHRYGVAGEKIDVVYNAVDLPTGAMQMKPIAQSEKIVLFLGRVTMQKGPEYFLQAAKKVVEKFQSVRFIVAGSGDMIRACIQMVADLRLGRYVTFTGFLRGGDVQRIFEMADLYVMPSVSEPFGIAPLEALSHNVPVLISKQSGVSEVLTHVLKVDFWDTDEMANKILAVLRHEPLQKTLRQQGQFELQKFSWQDSARNVKSVYELVIGK